MKKITITFETAREIDGDVYLWTTLAKRDGLVGYGSGYSPESSMRKSEANLIGQEFALSEKSQNWENTICSFLCRN